MYIHNNIQIKNERLPRHPGDFLLTTYLYLVRSSDHCSRHSGGRDQWLIRKKLDERIAASLVDLSLINELTKTVEMISILQHWC